MIIPDWLFKKPFENKSQKIDNPKLLKEVARENSKMDDEQLNKELAEKILNP